MDFAMLPPITVTQGQILQSVYCDLSVPNIKSSPKGGNEPNILAQRKN